MNISWIHKENRWNGFENNGNAPQIELYILHWCLTTIWYTFQTSISRPIQDVQGNGVVFLYKLSSSFIAMNFNDAAGQRMV